MHTAAVINSCGQVSCGHQLLRHALIKLLRAHPHGFFYCWSLAGRRSFTVNWRHDMSLSITRSPAHRPLMFSDLWDTHFTHTLPFAIIASTLNNLVTLLLTLVLTSTINLTPLASLLCWSSRSRGRRSCRRNNAEREMFMTSTTGRDRRRLV